MTNHTIKAVRTTIYLGDIPLDVYQMPDQSYKLAGRNVTDAVGEPNNSLTRSMGVKSLRDLPGSEKIASVTGEQVVTILPSIAVEYWHLTALKGNALAQDLLIKLRDFTKSQAKINISLPEIPIISKRFSVYQMKKNTRQIEKDIQCRLQNKTGGEIEVVCPVGKIDLLSSTELVEVKAVKHWKSAVGQVLTYGYYYPSHIKRIHLFGSAHTETKSLIENHCKRLDIRVTWEQDILD